MAPANHGDQRATGTARYSKRRARTVTHVTEQPREAEERVRASDVQSPLRGSVPGVAAGSAPRRRRAASFDARIDPIFAVRSSRGDRARLASRPQKKRFFVDLCGDVS